jgi:hypothetical protein
MASGMGVVQDAAVTDPDMAAQWATNEEQRLTAFRHAIRAAIGSSQPRSMFPNVHADTTRSGGPSPKTW